MKFKYDILIIGGLGHVGLPLGIVFASKGLKVCLQDINKDHAITVNKGKMPFVEHGAEEILEKVVANGNLTVSLDPASISEAQSIIIAIGTPIDQYNNPKIWQFIKFINGIKKYISPSQLIIVRSSIYPGTCKNIINELGNGQNWHLAYCPERILQGYAIRELEILPQIISGFTNIAIEKSSDLFKYITPNIIYASVAEAELVKLFSNAWRYIQFATANQFYMLSDEFGVNYDNVRKIMIEGYNRTSGLPSAGFTAGPCLLKDTMQLSAFSNTFLLGHSAMMINEGIPGYIVNKLGKKYDLSKMKVGILGMSFKAEIDDVRDSLSFKLGKILKTKCAEVFYSDEFAKNSDFISKETLINKSEIIIIGAPHSIYSNLSIPKRIEIIDIWGILMKDKLT